MRFRSLEIVTGLLCLALGMFLIFYDVHEQSVLEDQKEEIEQSIAEEEEAALEEAEAMSEIASQESAVKINPDEAAMFEQDQPKRKESLTHFLKRRWYGKKETRSIIESISKYFSPSKEGRTAKYYFKRLRDPETNKLHSVRIVLIDEIGSRKLSLIRNEDDEFVPEFGPIPLKKKTVYIRGTIKDNLYRDALKLGISKHLINEIIKVYSFSVDFQRGFKRGETFEIMYEKKYDEETGYIDRGKIKYSALYLAGGPMKIYHYDAPRGMDYFNENGEGVRKALLRTPVKGARISSGYGRRRHPILGYTRMHRGVDFAAPRGSPILAAGDGIVKKLGRLGGYGNYILVQHNAEYSTAYAHLHRYAKGLAKGTRVKQGQVIGYVGSTGRATAPHLHYEVHHRNRPINPRTLKMVPHQVLKGSELEKFIAIRDQIDYLVRHLKKHKR